MSKSLSKSKLTRSLFMSASLVALAIGFGCVAACGHSKTCTLIGCSSSVNARVAVPVELSDLGGATVILCHNTECFTRRVIESGDAAVGFAARCEPVVGSFMPCSFEKDYAPGGTSIMSVSLDIDTAAAVDGDVYILKLVDRNGNAVVNKQTTVPQYKASSVGETGCEITCKYASLTST